MAFRCMSLIVIACLIKGELKELKKDFFLKKGAQKCNEMQQRWKQNSMHWLAQNEACWFLSTRVFRNVAHMFHGLLW